MFERRVAISWFPWDSQPTYCSAVSAVCAPQVCALLHRYRDLGFPNLGFGIFRQPIDLLFVLHRFERCHIETGISMDYVQFRLWKKI